MNKSVCTSRSYSDWVVRAAHAIANATPCGGAGARQGRKSEVAAGEGVTTTRRSISVLVVIPRADNSHREREFDISCRCNFRRTPKVRRIGSLVDFHRVRRNFFPFQVDLAPDDALQIILLSHKRPNDGGFPR
jgi:hypothetical protein